MITKLRRQNGQTAPHMTYDEVFAMKLFQRVSALLLSALLLLAPVCAADGEAGFADVPETHWAYESVRTAAQKGLINGLSTKTFGLGQSVTRAQYCAMLCRLMDWKTVTPDKPTFTDNRDKTTWYYSAVETAYANGALLKLGSTCAPNDALPREEMAAMTVRALGYAQLAGTVQNDCPFSDVTTNRGYVALAYHMGFMGGVSERSFSPKTASTREQAAAVLLRVYDRLHAPITRAALDTAQEGTAVYAEPISDTSGRLPMCPRAPLESVYAAAVKAGKGGAVALLTSPWATTTKDGKVVSSAALPSGEFSTLSSNEKTVASRSARYESSYLVNTESNGTQTVVWYESADDVAEKVTLCRMLGVGTVYIEAWSAK